MVLMIIKMIFRRYEKWNPVHPTLGTFWGMGIGIGCGIGWGPGFGPEVIGYVGAGCGVGFSVGITLAGLGIGLPVNGVMQVPYSALVTNNDALESVKSNAFTAMKSVIGNSWNYVAPHASLLGKEARGRLSCFNFDNHLAQRLECTKLNYALSMHIRSTLATLEGFRDRCWSSGKGSAPK